MIAVEDVAAGTVLQDRADVVVSSILQARRLVDVLGDELLVTDARDFLGDAAQQNVSGITVCKLFAWGRDQWLRGKFLHRVFDPHRVIIFAVSRCACEIRYAGDVREQLLNGDLLPRLRHFRHVLHDGILETELLVLFELQDGDRGERFRDGPDAVDHLRRVRNVKFDVRKPVAFAEKNFAVLGNEHRSREAALFGPRREIFVRLGCNVLCQCRNAQ